MAKTIVSAIDQGAAGGIVHAAVASGFDAHLFSVLRPADKAGTRPKATLPELPSISARRYEKCLRTGDSVIVARVSDTDVARLIKILQSRGGRQIEAFDATSVC